MKEEYWYDIFAHDKYDGFNPVLLFTWTRNWETGIAKAKQEARKLGVADRYSEYYAVKRKVK